MKEIILKLGIVGGCLTHQPGIPRTLLYHQLLASNLAGQGIGLRVRISRGFERDPVHRVADLVDGGEVDSVLLHVRNTFVRKAGILATVVHKGVIRYYLHPFLFRPWRLGWSEVENRDFAGELRVMTRLSPLQRREFDPSDESRAETSSEDTTLPNASKKFLGLSLRALIYRAGRLAMLDRWMQRDELHLLGEVIDFCQERRLPLLIMGPSQRPEESYLNRLCIDMDRRLAKWIVPSTASYCSLMTHVDGGSASLYSRDGLHLNRAGHAHVARCLEPLVKSLALAVSR
jgi:hypothetical protein